MKLRLQLICFCYFSYSIGLSASLPCPDKWIYLSSTNFCYYMPEHIYANFDDAEAFCQKYGAHLASIHSDDDMKVIQTLTFSTWKWIGLKFEDQTFHWTDGTSVDYSKWPAYANTSLSYYCVLGNDTFERELCESYSIFVCKKTASFEG